MALGSFTSFNAGTTIVASQMNANFATVTSWSSELARLDGAAFTGACTWTNTITVGSDGTGYDVKFFGDTSSAYMLWDQSVDDLILAGAARIVIPDGQLVLASTAVTATAAELNIMDGVTASTGEINKLDGVTATTAEINTVAGVTAGTVSASKALVVDSNKDIASLRNVTLTGTLTFDSVGITAVTTSDETFADNDTSLLTAGAVVHRFLQYDVDGGADAGATLYIQASEPYADGAGGGVKGDIWIDT